MNRSPKLTAIASVMLIANAHHWPRSDGKVSV